MVCQIPFKLGLPSGMRGILKAGVCATAETIDGSKARINLQRVRILLPGVLPNDMNDVLIILIADVFYYFGVGEKRGVAVEGERPGVSARIVDSDIEIQMTEIGSAVAFDHVQFFGVGMGREIEPELVVEAHRIDYQRVAFPLSDGVAVPGGVGVFGMTA